MAYDDNGPDDSDQEVVAPPVQPAAAVVVAPPNRAAIVPPRFQPAPGYDPAMTAAEDTFRGMVNRDPTYPTEQAVAMAMKFQAIRGYRRDLDAGIPPATALARWAPSMFSGPKEANLGQAASLARAATPQEKYMDIGGVGYQMTGGKAIPLTPPKPVKEKTIPLVLPADPENPMSGGHVTIQLPENDPLVKKALDRARSGPPAAPPEQPGFIDKVKSFFGGGEAPSSPTSPKANSPASAPAPQITAPKTTRLNTPEEKLAAARALRVQHPDWTKKQILDAVNQMR